MAGGGDARMSGIGAVCEVGTDDGTATTTKNQDRVVCVVLLTIRMGLFVLLTIGMKSRS